MDRSTCTPPSALQTVAAAAAVGLLRCLGLILSSSHLRFWMKLWEIVVFLGHEGKNQGDSLSLWFISPETEGFSCAPVALFVGVSLSQAVV